MAEYIYTMTRARKAHNEKVILDDVSMSFYPGAKIGMVGPNGAGKSTILKIMAGLDQPSNGEARLAAGATVGILLQEPPLNEEKTVLGNVEEGAGEIKAKLDRYNEISAEMADPDADYDALLTEMGKLQEDIDHADAWDLDSQLEQAMDALRCPPGGLARDQPLRWRASPRRPVQAAPAEARPAPARRAHQPPRRRVGAVARAAPRGLPRRRHRRHPRPLLPRQRRPVDRRGRPRSALPLRGQLLDLPREEVRAPHRSRARRTPSSPSVSRPSSSGCAATPRAVRSRARRAWPATRRWRPRPSAPASSTSRSCRSRRARASGSTVIEVKNLKKGFGDRVLIDNLSFSLPRNGIVGVIGPNGVGKSTLFKTIVGFEQPDCGEVKIGETVKISYVDQGREGLDPKKNLWEIVSDGLDYMKVGNVEIPSRAYVSQFGFKGPDQQKLSGVLSGGERNRLNLALTLKQGGNLLLLDEPTNDLDVETLGSLENALLEFPGCAVVITHDRWFLDRVATHILAYEGTEENPAQLVLVRGQLRVLRGQQGRAARPRGGPSAPRHLPQADARLTCDRPRRAPATAGGPASVRSRQIQPLRRKTT